MSNTNLQPFNFESHALRVQMDEHGQPWFNASDVCAVLDYANPHKAVADHVDADDLTKREVIDSLGRTQSANHINESGLYALILGSHKEQAKRFKRWVTSEVLPTIRQTGSYTAPTSDKPQTQPSAAAKEFRALFGIARLIGCDRNVAAISANNAVTRLTGVNLLQTLGQTHLEAERQNVLWFTPTELGKRLGISARQFNLLLAEAGLQANLNGKWEPTEEAEGLFRLFDTSKRHGDGTSVTQLKWSDSVLGKLNQEAIEEGI